MKNILTSLNLSSLSPKEQEEMLLTLGDLVFRGTLLRLIEKMDDTTRKDFSKLLAGNASPEAVEAFLKTRVPGAESAAQETLADISSDLAALQV